LSRALGLFAMLAVAGLAPGGRSLQGTPPAEVKELTSPAGSGSSASNLSVSYSGQVLLSWIEEVAPRRFELRFSRLGTAGWSTPQTIARGQNWFVNWADFPSVVETAKNRMAAHWLAMSSAGKYSYDVRVALSSDGGKTWGESLVPHRDGTPTEHGFVSMFAWREDQIGIVWLDGRAMKPEGSDHSGHGGGDMSLRFTTIDAAGRLGAEVLLDDRVCECCQTSAARSGDRVVVVYRDRSRNEIRDTGVVRFADGSWSKPEVLHADNWEINGCPVNGPAIAAAGKQVAAAWFSAGPPAPHVRVAFSQDGGRTFGAPVDVDDGAPVGRVDVILIEQGAALVSWIEDTAAGSEIRVRRVSAAGRRDASRRVAMSSNARAAGFPQMARSGRRVVFSWTDPSIPRRIRTAELVLAGPR